ncbi:LysR family transcriptional regulator [Clostridium sp. MCC353]|uniref:selenium metabolism-associated LysR family transcriptional regulator n=1 Tax=Clostridium sp. MCC353 TaxID=2592646 RepID=UPI001C00FECE|nr:selenium metabolism-associated LysR family transcriptional regulator [Clostridium sp. MCC353]MBT9779504.1 LysR family transcriptional regulator [Clostridium sp. MCC353]
MNLKQLEAFVCVTEVKSFSKAAKKLYLTQPTISAHINSLEKELGRKLFIRTTKDVFLSADGQRLYEKARQMLQLEKSIWRDFEEKENPEKRKMIVGASTVPGQYILPQALSLFCQNYPENELQLLEADSEAVIRMILDGEIEVGFTGTKIENASCVYEPFYSDRLVLITPNQEEYRQFKGDGYPLEQLYQEKMIVREDGSGTRKETEQFLKDEGIDTEKLHVVATISNQETIKKSVGSGMGVSIISSAAVEDYVQQGLVLKFHLGGKDVCRKLYMVWNRNRKPGMAARTFLQFVRDLYEYI